jgi:hypothetical protein
MVVKSATKKKLMDLGIDENFAHALADDRKWDDVKVMTQADIAKICETDSETAGNIHATIIAATQKGRDGDAESTGPVTKVRLSGRSSKRRRKIEEKGKKEKKKEDKMSLRYKNDQSAKCSIEITRKK